MCQNPIISEERHGTKNYIFNKINSHDGRSRLKSENVETLTFSVKYLYIKLVGSISSVLNPWNISYVISLAYTLTLYTFHYFNKGTWLKRTIMLTLCFKPPPYTHIDPSKWFCKSNKCYANLYRHMPMFSQCNGFPGSHSSSMFLYV